MSIRSSLSALSLACAVLLACSLGAGCGDKEVQRPDPPTGPSSKPASMPTKPAETKPAETKTAETKPAEATGTVDHKLLDGVLQIMVRADGAVKYKVLKESEVQMKLLNTYIGQVASADVSKMSKDEQLAFYINAYNAYTIKAVVDRYPIESVMKVDGFFKGIKHKVAGEDITLDTLENQKIREGFKEARIHFVVNCASASCPKIRNRALTKDNMNELMDLGAKEYIQAQTKATGWKVTTSKIFEWFAKDFETAEGSVQNYLAKYSTPEQAAKIKKAKKLGFSEYDWSLNDAK